MNCQAPLPADDDGVRRDLWHDDEPFTADDELLPVDGATPRDAGDADGPDPMLQGLAIFGVVFLIECVGVALLVWWRSGT